MRRKAPSPTALLQRQIDQALDSIDGVFDMTEYDGLKILKGHWPADCGDWAAPGTCQARSMTPAVDRRTVCGSGSLLPSFRETSWDANDKTRIAEALAVVREAAARVADRQEHFAMFLEERIEPLLSEIAVAGENTRAALMAQNDLQFAASAGCITMAEALANLGASRGRDVASTAEPGPSTPRLTIRRE